MHITGPNRQHQLLPLPPEQGFAGAPYHICPTHDLAAANAAHDAAAGSISFAWHTILLHLLHSASAAGSALGSSQLFVYQLSPHTQTASVLQFTEHSNQPPALRHQSMTAAASESAEGTACSSDQFSWPS